MDTTQATTIKMSPSMFIDGSIEALAQAGRTNAVDRLRRCSSTAPLKREQLRRPRGGAGQSPSMFIDGSIEASGLIPMRGCGRRSPSMFIDGSIEAGTAAARCPSSRASPSMFIDGSMEAR